MLERTGLKLDFSLEEALAKSENPPLLSEVLDAARQLTVKEGVEKGREEAKAEYQQEIERLQREKEIAEENSYVDGPTGCQNRKSWENSVKNKLDPRRDKISLIVLDVNNLKKINDEQGHSIGDIIILKTAIFIQKNLRKGDVLYRYGGDEFIAECHNVLDQDTFVEKINKRFADDILKKNGISFAFGIAHFDENIDTEGLAFIPDKNKTDDIDPKKRKTTINRADQLMYQKKAEQKSEQEYQQCLAEYSSINEKQQPQ